MEQWETIYSTNKLYEAELLKNILCSNNIEAVIFNQKDSMYLFGDIEIKVANKDIDLAKTIISEFNSENQ